MSEYEKLMNEIISHNYNTVFEYILDGLRHGEININEAEELNDLAYNTYVVEASWEETRELAEKGRKTRNDKKIKNDEYVDRISKTDSYLRKYVGEPKGDYRTVQKKNVRKAFSDSAYTRSKKPGTYDKRDLFELTVGHTKKELSDKRHIPRSRTHEVSGYLFGGTGDPTKDKEYKAQRDKIESDIDNYFKNQKSLSEKLRAASNKNTETRKKLIKSHPLMYKKIDQDYSSAQKRLNEKYDKKRNEEDTKYYKSKDRRDMLDNKEVIAKDLINKVKKGKTTPKTAEKIKKMYPGAFESVDALFESIDLCIENEVVTYEDVYELFESVYMENQLKLEIFESARNGEITEEERDFLLEIM